MTKPLPVYKLPDAGEDELISFLCASNSCRYCKHVKDIEDYEWYTLGDTTPDAYCSKLSQRVSSHVGTCSAYSKSLAHCWKDLGYKLKTWWLDAYWWVAHRVSPRHRYHVINTGLKPGYYDPDIRLLSGLFTEVISFMRDNHWDWTQIDSDKQAYKDLVAAAEFGKAYLGTVEAGVLAPKPDEHGQAIRHAKKVLDNLNHMWY